MASTSPTPVVADDAAQQTADEVAAAILPKPKRNGVQVVSDKPATRKPKAKATTARKPKPTLKPLAQRKADAAAKGKQLVPVNGQHIEVDGKLNRADARKAARAALRLVRGSGTPDVDRPAKTTRAKKASVRMPRTPLNTFAKYMANGPSGAHGEQFEKGMATTDTEYLQMLEQALGASKAKRARVLAAMFAAMRVHYNPAK